VGCPEDIYDMGTHYFDMCGCYAGEAPAEWVIGQIDYRTERRVFGAHAENQALASWRYQGGVFGLIATGPNAGLVGTTNRLVGTEGVIEVGVHGGPLLRLRRRGSMDWEVVDTGGESLHGPGFYERAIGEAIDALRSGRESELSACSALNATEIIFAIHESSRCRGRVDLPLTIADNPLAAMVEAGQVQPSPS
jgi:predicted dehydrogenase